MTGAEHLDAFADVVAGYADRTSATDAAAATSVPGLLAYLDAAEAVENGLANQVRCGPDIEAFGCAQNRAPGFAGNNAHGGLNPLANHIFEQIGHAAAIAPFVIIPTDQFEKPLVQFDAGTLIEDGRER